MSPPSACRAGRMASMASSSCDSMTVRDPPTEDNARASSAVPGAPVPRRLRGAAAGDVGADGSEVAGQVLVAALDVVGVGHDRLALRPQAGHDQGGAGPDVGG